MSTMLMDTKGMQPHVPIQGHECRDDLSHHKDRPSAIVVSMRLLCECLRHMRTNHQYKAAEDYYPCKLNSSALFVPKFGSDGDSTKERPNRQSRSETTLAWI